MNTGSCQEIVRTDAYPEIRVPYVYCISSPSGVQGIWKIHQGEVVNVLSMPSVQGVSGVSINHDDGSVYVIAKGCLFRCRDDGRPEFIEVVHRKEPLFVAAFSPQPAVFMQTDEYSYGYTMARVYLTFPRESSEALCRMFFEDFPLRSLFFNVVRDNVVFSPPVIINGQPVSITSCEKYTVCDTMSRPARACCPGEKLYTNVVSCDKQNVLGKFRTNVDISLLSLLFKGTVSGEIAVGVTEWIQRVGEHPSLLTIFHGGTLTWIGIISDTVREIYIENGWVYVHTSRKYVSFPDFQDVHVFAPGQSHQYVCTVRIHERGINVRKDENLLRTNEMQEKIKTRGAHIHLVSSGRGEVVLGYQPDMSIPFSVEFIESPDANSVPSQGKPTKKRRRQP